MEDFEFWRVLENYISESLTTDLEIITASDDHNRRIWLEIE